VLDQVQNTKLHFETIRGKDIHNPIARPMSREMSQKKFFAFNRNSQATSANALQFKAPRFNHAEAP